VLQEILIPVDRPSEAGSVLPCAEWLATAAGAQIQPAASPIERLFEALNAHIEAHHALLSVHRRLAASTKDPAVRFLMEQVAESKYGHQTLLRKIAASLHDALHWTQSPDALPRTLGRQETSAREQHAILCELVRQEREMGRTSRQLAKAYAQIDGGLDKLLLENVATDCHKHERVLQFALQLLQVAIEESESDRGATERPTAAQILEAAVGARNPRTRKAARA